MATFVIQFNIKLLCKKNCSEGVKEFTCVLFFIKVYFEEYTMIGKSKKKANELWEESFKK